MAIIKTENMSHVYSEGTPFVKTAIDNINIEIEEGEMFVTPQPNEMEQNTGEGAVIEEGKM